MMSRQLGVRQVLMQWGLGTICAVAAIVAGTAVAADAPRANAIRFELPPLVQPATGEHHPGKVIWADLVTPDLAGAKRFYGSLFGWTFNDIHTGDTEYSVALRDGEPMGGLLQRPVRTGEQRQPAWLTFISVRDVGAAERVIVAQGGKVLSKPRTYPQRGRQAVFADPQGAVFAVLESSSGDPADELADPGEWIWSSVVSRDPGKGAAFYQAVFGYEAFDLPDEDGLEHVLLSSGDYARASANELPAEAARTHSHWLNFVRVISTPDTVAKVQALGGRVLVEPHPDRHGGLVAIVADPAGAVFGLLEWTVADSKETAK
jgi:predicted enzyme related to lactoylglutathione lyase